MKKKLNLTYREILKSASLSFNKNTDVIAFGEHKYLLDALIEEDFLKVFNMFDDFDALIQTCYERLKYKYKAEIIPKDIPFKEFNDNLKKFADFKVEVMSTIGSEFSSSFCDHNFVLYSAEKDDTGKVAYIHKHWRINVGMGFLSDWKWTESVISRNTLKLLGVVRS